jgi:hypothetical protein
MTFTTNKNLEQPALGTDINTWYIPLNSNFSTIDSAFSGSTSISLSGLSSPFVKNLTQADLIPSQINLTGTLAGNTTVNIPTGGSAISGSWVINTKGIATTTYTITIQNGSSTTPAGATISMPINTTAAIYSDGTNVYFSDSRPLGVPTGGAGDEIFFVNSQTITTNYTIPTGYNAVTAGPVTINSGVTVTIPSGSTWAVV